MFESFPASRINVEIETGDRHRLWANRDNKRIVNRYFGAGRHVLGLAGIYMEHLAEFRPLEVDREITRIVMDLLRRWRARTFGLHTALWVAPSLFAYPCTAVFWTEISGSSWNDSSVRIFTDMNFQVFETDWHGKSSIRFFKWIKDCLWTFSTPSPFVYASSIINIWYDRV